MTVTPQTKLKQLSDRFLSQPALQAIVVIDDQCPVGIIGRSGLLELFSTPFGRALHENHAVTEVMDRNVLHIEASAPLSSVSQQLTADNEHTVAQQFIVLRQGKFIGIGHTKDLLQRITEHRIKMARHANPLTGLPGNVPIQEELKRLRQHKKPYYLAYFDLCHFKPYNDIYGFCRGDEVIQEVANLLNEHQGPDNFIGHIGGDDFVMISTSSRILEQCRTILSHFNSRKPLFYTEEHWQAKQLLAEDRQGHACYHALISLCVGILPPTLTYNTHEHTLSALSANAKKQAKLANDGFYLLEDKARLIA